MLSIDVPPYELDAPIRFCRLGGTLLPSAPFEEPGVQLSLHTPQAGSVAKLTK